MTRIEALRPGEIASVPVHYDYGRKHPGMHTAARRLGRPIVTWTSQGRLWYAHRDQDQAS